MKTGLITLMLLLSFIGYSQDYEFKVLASSGSNKVILNGTTDQKSLYCGKKLNKGDKIIVNNNAYVGMVYKNGKTIELKKSGTYDVITLINEVSKQNSSTNSKYANYLAGQMDKVASVDMTRNKYKYMAVTGSVERSEAVIPLYIDSTNNFTILGSSAFIKWEPVEGTSTYKVYVTNLFGDEIISTETSATSITVPLNTNDRNYIVTITSSETPNLKNDLHISRVSRDLVESLNTELKELHAQLPENTALNKLILAVFYEENKLYSEAMFMYEYSITLEKDVDDYKLAYNQFLERVKIAKIK